MADDRHLGFLKSRFLTVAVQEIILPHHAKFRGDQTPSRDISIYHFFRYSGRPPSCICCARVWTIRKQYLVVVFIVVQNLYGIDAVILIICMF